MAGPKGGGKHTKRIRRKQNPHYFTEAGPVTITRSDGSTETRQPYTPDEFQRITKTRWTVPPKTRSRVLRRDHGACRYCGSDQGPFHIDHVVPVALGGTCRIGNLVTSCEPCNLRKGAAVWQPRPVSC